VARQHPLPSVSLRLNTCTSTTKSITPHTRPPPHPQQYLQPADTRPINPLALRTQAQALTTVPAYEQELPPHTWATDSSQLSKMHAVICCILQYRHSIGCPYYCGHSMGSPEVPEHLMALPSEILVDWNIPRPMREVCSRDWTKHCSILQHKVHGLVVAGSPVGTSNLSGITAVPVRFYFVLYRAALRTRLARLSSANVLLSEPSPICTF
jgi:hypothetical protein